MSDCSQAQERLLAGSGLVHELPDETQSHVGDCEPCQEFALRRRRLRRLAKNTQEIVRKDVGLSPTAWARIRTAIDDTAPRESIGLLFFRWFPVAALPVLVIALGWVLLDQQPKSGSTELAQMTPGTVDPVEATSGSFATLDTATGGVIEVGDKDAVATLALGHKLEFGARSKLALVRLSEKAVALRLVKGKVTCEVRKLKADEIFEVHAGDLRVSVVGTKFTVSMSDDGTASVSVEEGQVAVHRKDAERQLLGAGENYKQPIVAVVEEPADEPLEKPDSMVAEADVSGVPVLKTAQRKALQRRVLKKTLAIPASESVPAPKPPKEKSTPKIIEVTVPAQAMEPQEGSGPRGVRSRLVGVIGMIRSGNCSAALIELRNMTRNHAGLGSMSDISYLTGYCLHKQGNKERAATFFELYRKRGGSQRWKVPTDSDEVLPVPSVSRLGS
jgi:ferric-dicitrate binding protein FerR (iron transport regulator)